MPDIVLTTFNAKYIHAAFGLRYLLANLGELRPRAELLEFDLRQRPVDVAERILAGNPRVVGIGAYIWNAGLVTELAAVLKRLEPGLVMVLGGPEISFETEAQPMARWADYVITGEGDLAFGALCRELLAGKRPAQKIITPPLPDLEQLVLPYADYTAEDIAHRVLYVEASRGCPFSCEFCLSSLDLSVRQFPLAGFLRQLGELLARGAQQLKFVDRTFNLNLAVAREILQFCHDHWEPGRLFHFEMIPDRLPEELREVIAAFPPGALQFEVGVQSFNPAVCARISRRQNIARLEANLRYLRTKTGVHVHADLILGLPGESLDSMAAGFDRLVHLGPQEIQVGILKRLRGTPIARHDAEWGMVYSPHPPYEILRNQSVDFATLQRLRRFARYWDLVGNSGNFVETTRLLWADPHQPRRARAGSEPPAESGGSDGGNASAPQAGGSPFQCFLRWSDWLFDRVHRTDSIALPRLAEHMFTFLTSEVGHDPAAVAEILWRDYQRGGRHEPPEFLRPWLRQTEAAPRRAPVPRAQKRQARHHA